MPPEGGKDAAEHRQTGQDLAQQLILLSLFRAVGGSWDAHTRELICFVGWLNVAALGNLLPLPGYDGAYVWRRTWEPHPAALAHLPSLALLAMLVVGGTSVLVPEGAVHSTFTRLDTGLFLFVIATGFALVARRLSDPTRAGGPVDWGSRSPLITLQSPLAQVVPRTRTSRNISVHQRRELAGRGAQLALIRLHTRSARDLCSTTATSPR